MSTPFSKISKLMQLEMQESDLYKSGGLNSDVALDVISDYILISSNVDFTTCQQDLTQYSAYSETTISQTISTVSTTLSIDITNIDLNKQDNIVLYINDIETTNFTYENSSNTCTITYLTGFAVNDNVEVIFLFEGEFTADLSFREQYIVALGAYIHYLDSKINIENVLYKRLGDKDYSITRGTISSDLLSLKNSVRSQLTNYIITYDRQASSIEDLM